MMRYLYRLLLCIAAFVLNACLIWAVLFSTYLWYPVSGQVEFGGIRSDLTFPLRIDNTTLIVENLSSYDGAFYEDGSGREVMNVAAIRLRNVGCQMVLSAEIELCTHSGKYAFEAMMIPPFASVLVPEKDAAILQDHSVVDCGGTSRICGVNYETAVSVHIVDKEVISIKNISNMPIIQLKVIHKTYLPDADLYIGGRPFVTEIPYILPNECIQVFPICFAQPYSKIIFIQ